jgi:hypothetical protein
VPRLFSAKKIKLGHSQYQPRSSSSTTATRMTEMLASPSDLLRPRRALRWNPGVLMVLPNLFSVFFSLHAAFPIVTIAVPCRSSSLSTIRWFPKPQLQGRVHRSLTREAHSGVFFLAPPSHQSGDRSSRSFRFDAELQNDLRSVRVQFRQKQLWLSVNIRSRFLLYSNPISNSAGSFLVWQHRVMGSNYR